MNIKKKRAPLVLNPKTAPLWEKVGLFHHHGVALPLSALYKDRGSCIGGILDLLPIIDWLHEVGMDSLQLLPLNDMGEDFSPYNSTSSFAIDPVYISIDTPSIPWSPRVNFKKAKERKIAALFDYYKQKKPPISPFFQQEHFQNFALFKSPKKPSKEQINFQLFLQETAFTQLKKVKEYASQKKILLISDMPLFVSQKSADVSAYPNLFSSRYVVGAPPDKYSPDGQKWNFWAFNWPEHKGENFLFWQRRIVSLASYSHLYRLDHAVGLFRLFVMEKKGTPFKGFFLPAKESLWEDQGRDILEKFLSFADILPIAEDLGVIPPATYKVLNELSIPGTKVMRWEKNVPIKDYPPLSLTTISTHDSEPLALWWRTHEEDAAQIAASKKWTYTPTLTPAERLSLLKDAHHTGSLFHINLLQEYLALVPELAWEDAEDDRINVPGLFSSKNWSYRFRASIEEITSNQKLKAIIKTLL